MADPQNPYAAIAIKDDNPYANIAIKPPTPPTPPTTGQKILGFGKDLGKGLLESVGGTLDTIGAPAGWIAKGTGLVKETPEQRQQQNQLFKPANATQAVGAGIGDAAQYFVPVEKAASLLAPAGKAVGEFAKPVMNKLSEFNQAVNPLPLRSRAISNLNKIEGYAKDAPLSFENTEPSLNRFQEHVATGGRGSEAMSKLIPRAEQAGDMMNPRPLLFPEARKFYSNITKEAAPPGAFGRLMETTTVAGRKAPAMRQALGDVKGGLHGDLVQAAEETQPGLGNKYQAAINETRQAENLKRYVKRAGYGAGALVGAKALNEMGLLGDLAKKIPGGQ